MKKILFFFGMFAGVTASTQTLSIKIATINYSTKIATCDLSWTARNTTHLSDVWVFVDFIEISGNTTTGTWKPAAITGATVTQQTTGNATASMVSGNTRGVWIKSVTSGANFTGQIALQLSGVPAQFNACAYATDFPPNVTLDKGTYTFKGTTNFIVSNPAQTVTTKTIAKTNLTVNASTTFTDATGCPGIGSLYCPYTESDLYMDATHLCRQRTSGNLNWEAWIRDTRDNKLYKIVYMPDSKWWMAQNLDYRSGTYTYRCGNDQTTYCDKYGIMLHLTDIIPTNICPSGWSLPTIAQMQAIGSTEAQVRKLRSTTIWLGPSNTTSAAGTDDYSFSLLATGYKGNGDSYCYNGEGYFSYLILAPTNNSQGVEKEYFITGRVLQTPCYNWNSDEGWSKIGKDSGNDWAYLRCLR